MKSSPTFLITRLSHIGDCVLTLPLAQQIKQFWPESKIYWAMESPSHKLLGHISDIDEIVLVPKGYLKSVKQIWTVRKVLRALQIDIALDPQSLTKSSMLAWLSGARTRIGLGGDYQKEFSGWLNNVQVPIDSMTTHLVDRTLALLPSVVAHSAMAKQSIVDPKGRIGQPIRSQAIFAQGADETVPARDGDRLIDLNFPIPVGIARWAKDYLASHHWTSSPVVINPGASWPSKRWVPKRFAQVAAGLFEKYNQRSIVTWAGKEEKEWARSIVDLSNGAAEMAPDTDLVQLCAMYREAKLFIGCDTGPMHMAAAVGTPCVVLFGPTRPQDSGPYGLQHVALQAWHQTGGARQRRASDNLAMQDITVDQVLAACDKILRAPA